MTIIPVAGFFNVGARTNAEAKDGQDDMLAVLRELLGGEAPTELTIATGSITPIQAIHTVDTELDASTDNLDNIVQTSHPIGRLLLLLAQDTARTVVVRHNIGGAGTILTTDALSFTIDETDKWILLQRVGTTWVERMRDFGNSKASARTYLGLGTTAVLNEGTGATDVPDNTTLTDTARTFTVPQRGDITTLTAQSGAIALGFDTQATFDYTFNGDFSLSNPTGVVVGQKGTIVLRQDATGGRSLTSMGTNWNRSGATGVPVMPSAASAIARIDYHVVTTTEIHYTFAEVEG